MFPVWSWPETSLWRSRIVSVWRWRWWCAGAILDPAASTPVAGSIDEIVVAGRELYLFCPNGQGRAKLPNFDRQLGQPVTVRNWNTVARLLSMTAAG